jgi:outer membrane protein OmpA-like peptidoglycan-associated protein/tetratricopeptide (TPR) repeat protein
MDILNLKCVLSAVIFMVITSVSAQNVKFEHSNFPNRENDLNNALSAIDQGEKFLFEAEAMLVGRGIDIRHKVKAIDMISKGLELFLQANAFNPQSAQLNYTIGKSYLYVENYELAAQFLRKAMLLDEKGFKDIHFLIGQIYQQRGEFELAIESYNIAARNYGNEANWSDIISAKIKECKYAQELMSDAVDVRVENMGVAMNSASMEYFPVITGGDEILFFERFSSGRNKLYAAERTSSGWKKAVETNQSFLLPQKEKETLTELTLVDRHGVPAITRWFAVNIGSQQQIDQDYYESLAASSKSPDKTAAFFSSNRYEGAGGFDIFFSQSNKKGQWERPRGVSEINTAGDEYGVVMHPDGRTLFFSSNGHQTMGGYDIFKSEYDGKHWSKPENVGYPINSTADDIVYSISEDGNRLYFSSNRISGKGGYDVYLVNFMPDVMPSHRTESVSMNVSAEALGIISADEPLTVSEVSATPATVAPSITTKYPAALHGFISDNQTYAPLSNVTLRLLDKSNNAEEKIETDIKGVFYATLSAGGSYRIAIDIPGYQSYVEDFKISEEVGQKLSKNIGLSPVTGENVAVAETLPEQPEIAPESNEEYEDVVVLTPILTNGQPQEEAVTEYPVAIAGLVTDNETFAPVRAATIKVVLKDSDDEHIFETDSKGLVNFYLASGNTYVITASAADYEVHTEELVLTKGPDQKLSKTFQLQAIPPVVVAEVIPEPKPINLLEAEAAIEEEPVITTPVVELVPVPVLVEEPEPEVEPVPEPVVEPAVPVVVEEPIVEATPEEPVVEETPEPAVEPVAPVAVEEPIVEATPEEPVVEETPEPVVEPVAPVVVEEPVVEEPIVEATPEPVQEENVLYEEDVVVLAPVLPLFDGSDSIAETREYPVDLKIYVSNSQTLQPLAVPVKLAVKDADMDQMLQTDERGMLDVTVASGNTYRLVVEYEGYLPVTEDFDVAKGPGQSLTHNILLMPLAPAVTPEKVVAEVVPVAEEEQPVAIEEPVIVPEPVVEEVVEETPEPVAEEIVEETPEPAVEPATPVVVEEPIVEAIPEPVVEEVVEETPEPVVEPAAPVVVEEPVVEVAPEPIIEEKTKETPPAKKVEEGTPVTEIPVVETPVKKTQVAEKATSDVSTPAVIALSGTIVSADTRKPVTAAVVALTDATRGITEVIKVSDKGKFSINTLAGSNYSVKVTAEGYQTVVRDIITSSKDREINVPVELYPVAETFVAAIYFDFDRAALNETAEQTLNEVIAILKQGGKVSLIGYTDNAGGQGYNKRLSERRAETVSTYLRVHGIAPADIAMSWKGVFNPAETNFTLSGRKLNNRVEIWVK